MFFPLEAAFIESFAGCAASCEVNQWTAMLISWITTSITYLDTEDDILDGYQQKEAVEWYSSQLGRDFHAQNGPYDLRVSKRIGSGREPLLDSRGRPLQLTK